VLGDQKESCKEGHHHKQGEPNCLQTAKKRKGYYKGQTEEPHCGLFNIEETNTRHCSLVGLQQQAVLGHL